MKCEKCQDRGFTEEEHGLIRVFCDCEKGKALKREITGEIDDSDGGTGQPDVLTIEVPEKALEAYPEINQELIHVEALNEHISQGTGQNNQPIGSTDTGKPKRTRKPKTKKKARKKSS